MNGRRVVVTGMGIVSPVGNTVAETWENILAGKSGASTIDTFDVSAYNTQFSANVKGFDINDYLPPKEARKMDVFVQFGMVAGIQARVERSGPRSAGRGLSRCCMDDGDGRQARDVTP